MKATSETPRDAVSEMFSALAHPIRSKLFSLLLGTEASARTLAEYFDVSRPAISQHLQILVSCGLVTVRRSGTRANYLACPEKLELLHQALTKMESRDPMEYEQVEVDSPRPRRKRFDPKTFKPELVWITYETTPEGALKIEAQYRL